MVFLWMSWNQIEDAIRLLTLGVLLHPMQVATPKPTLTEICSSISIPVEKGG
jgi:hypothetical protein